MKERSFDEMVAYFNRRVSEMDIAQDYKMELLGMVTALGYKHEKTAQPEQILPDGTLHLITDADLYKVGRVLVSQNGTHYGCLYYADGEPKDRPKARDVYYEESDHCEFKCSLCHATIGVVEGGTLDGASFRFCPNCGTRMEDGDE